LRVLLLRIGAMSIDPTKSRDSTLRKAACGPVSG
jgi:hypothetical protein